MTNKIFASSLWMLGGNGLQNVIQFAIFILLARFLTPEVFGSVAMATIIYELASAVGKWGVAEVIFQRRKMTPLFQSHAIVFTVGLAALLVLLILLGTAVYVAYVGPNLLAELLLILCPVAILQAIELVPETVLRLRFNYKWLAVRNNIAALLGGLVAVGLAGFGLGVYALVAQRLVSLIILVFLVLYATWDVIRIYPIRRYRKKAFLAIGRVGFHMVSPSLAGIIGPRISDMMVGAFFGAAALGALRVTGRVFNTVIQLTVSPISNVSQAAFTQFVGNAAELKKIYFTMQGACALGIFPIYAGLAICATDWVPLLLGTQWLSAIILIQLISFASIPAVVNYFQSPLLIAFRRNRIVSVQSLLRVISGAVLTALAIPFSVEAVLLLFVIQGYVFMVVNFFILRTVAGWKISEMVRNILPSICASAAMALALFAFRQYNHTLMDWSRLGTEMLLGITVYAAVMGSLFRSQTMYLIGYLTKFKKSSLN